MEVLNKFAAYLILLAILYGFFPYLSDAATNIDTTYRYAWNDVIGWVDLFQPNSVIVQAGSVVGYASSSIGYIQFNCNTPPPTGTSSCSFNNWRVINTGGALTGWAWSESIGWISFDSVTAGAPVAYQVNIAADGKFSGYAWNDVIGWISFNCSNTSTCSGSGGYDYWVSTTWAPSSATGSLVSSTFDSGKPGGVVLKSVVWKGNLNGARGLGFQFASANSTSGPWVYRGPDGSTLTEYDALSPEVAVPINPAYHYNHRYFRYKVTMYSDNTQTKSPLVEDIIINWSP